MRSGGFIIFQWDHNGTTVVLQRKCVQNAIEPPGASRKIHSRLETQATTQAK